MERGGKGSGKQGNWKERDGKEEKMGKCILEVDCWQLYHQATVCLSGYGLLNLTERLDCYNYNCTDRNIIAKKESLHHYNAEVSFKIMSFVYEQLGAYSPLLIVV